MDLKRRITYYILGLQDEKNQIFQTQNVDFDLFLIIIELHVVLHCNYNCITFIFAKSLI